MANLVRNGGSEDVSHTLDHLVPGVGGDCLTHCQRQVLQTVGPRSGQLLVVWGREGGEGEEGGKEGGREGERAAIQFLLH